MNDIYTALSSQVATYLWNGAAHERNRLCGVEQVSFHGLFLNTACEMSGARSSTGRLFRYEVPGQQSFGRLISSSVVSSVTTASAHWSRISVPLQVLHNTLWAMQCRLFAEFLWPLFDNSMNFSALTVSWPSGTTSNLF